MSKWYKASEIERLNAPTPRDGVNGLPDNHVITVSERVIEIDESELVQNNVSTDTFTLELDAEWDDITPVVIFSNSQGDYQVAYENGPTKIPAAAMAVIGPVDVSVFGLDSTGEVRVVTKAAPNTMDVVESGKFVGEISEDDVSLLGQILAAVEAANKAAENANATIIKSAVATTLNPGEPATANLADNVLTIGVPKGEKGDKGNPGQDGVTPFTQASVTTLEPGAPATVAIEEDTLKLGIPKGDKGDTGDQGDKGETGDKGDPGTAATIAVGSVTGLDAGASPTVVNSGTSTAARFDFGIPKGDKGDTGDPGHTPQRGVDYWTAEDVEGVVEDAKARAVAELAEIGNVPKKTVTDLVAHAEDAYAQKPVEVRIKGRTVKNLWVNPKGTDRGSTVTENDDGSVTISGTSTTAEAVSLTNILFLKPNTKYTFVINKKTTDGCRFRIGVNYDGGTYVEADATTEGKTFTTPSEVNKTVFQLAVDAATTISGTYRLMLVEGTEAPDCFTPPASITSVQPGNLVTSGKNLLDYTKLSGKWFGVGYFAPGTYTMQLRSLRDWWTNNAGNDYSIYWYLFSDAAAAAAAVTAAAYGNIVGYIASGSSRFVNSSVGSVSSTSINLDYAGYVIFIYYGANEFVGTFVDDVQLELGSTATAYESPNITQTPLPEVELRSLPYGATDELVIGADGTATVERQTYSYTFTGEESISYTQSTGQITYNLGVKVVAATAICDVLASGTDGVTCAGTSVYIKESSITDVETGKQWLATKHPTVIVQLQDSETEPQSPVTLPVLPAPTFNQYHDADVPSDTSTIYTRDINIALADIEAKIADLVTKEAANV